MCTRTPKIWLSAVAIGDAEPWWSARLIRTIPDSRASLSSRDTEDRDSFSARAMLSMVSSWT